MFEAESDAGVGAPAAGIDLGDPATYSSTEAQAALEAAADDLDASGVNDAADNVSEHLSAICASG